LLLFLGFLQGNSLAVLLFYTFHALSSNGVAAFRPLKGQNNIRLFLLCSNFAFRVQFQLLLRMHGQSLKVKRCVPLMDACFFLVYNYFIMMKYFSFSNCPLFMRGMKGVKS